MSLTAISAPLALRQRGFTLIEILVAILVFSMGLLGLAGLQAVGARNNHSAYLRSQAVLQAYDMTDRLRANPQGVNAGNYNSVSGIPTKPTCLTTGCTPAQLATYDTWEWNTMNAAVLPLGAGTVGVASGVFSITLQWDDDRDGDRDSQDPNFSLEFRP